MRYAALLAACLCIAGCNAGDGARRSAGANNLQASGNAAAADMSVNNLAADAAGDADDNAQLAAAPPPRRDPGGVDREWFAGFWTDTGDCADAGQFGTDGRYRLADGTRGMWNVQNGRLVIENAGGRRVIRVRKINDGAVETVTDDGQASRSTRCARVTPRAAPVPDATPAPDQTED